MTFALHGLAVSSGIAIGHAQLISHATLEVDQYQLREREVAAELSRFDEALETVRAELGQLKLEAEASVGAAVELSAFVDLQLMFLDDPLLAAASRVLIKERRCNAEWALVQQMEYLVAQFDEMEDAYLRERKQDIVQVVERILKVLMGRARKIGKRKGREDVPAIVVAHDLSPADTIQFKRLSIGGFVTDLGGATSHTAIVARSLAIPAVVGLHHARSLIRDDDLLIVDGTRGVLIVNPDERVLEEYRLRQGELQIERNKLKRLRTARTQTLDGEDVQLYANIELPQDIDQVKEVGAAGVGLFRTEFLFMNRDDLPSEDEQFEAYRRVVKTLADKPVTIRTLDVGADKQSRALRTFSQTSGGRTEPNPALGRRAIRYCLAEPQIFLTHLRAILRASQYGKAYILIPMLAHAHEIEQTLEMIALAKQQLRDARIKFDDTIKVGGMIEIPAAAMALGPFLKRLDFLSIGTNDLIQYTLAIDRSDEAVAHLYDPLHPAVLRLVAQTIERGNRAGLPVAVCGEMAGDVNMTRLLLGMGLRKFSLHPAQLLEVRQQVLKSDAAALQVAVTRLLRLDDSARIREQLAKINA
ncbi:phosphoenolpyruvate-protein phosphotransferase [Sterolibacterium denitrificans]|uniref:Phosphoenolpyruvate-protein phosphotransferase n=1 Tax=Sterolibacterium denitrificans TaxID=157592 RepID=A0A656Z841_9PROT|nr:phosphoenolpyruvate--protein phosphotransferase [Sterolibacterium denitrificans]KYC29001.1 phosphoenolpyruvate-protein phosphotransferase [Sterolibacterium denitrificans]